MFTLPRSGPFSQILSHICTYYSVSIQLVVIVATLLFLVDEDGVMAGLKGSMVGFMLVVVYLAVVPSVNGKPCALFAAEDVIAGQSNGILSPILVFACVVGACTSQSQCYPGRCLLGQCDCPEGYSDSGSSCSANRECTALCSTRCKRAAHSTRGQHCCIGIGWVYVGSLAGIDLTRTPVRISHTTGCSTFIMIHLKSHCCDLGPLVEWGFPK